MADVKPISTLEREFSRVILTLENVLIPDEKLSPTPSMQDGLDLETETDLRILGCELIQTSGILLKLPQVAMATGQVLFQRFYYSKSFLKHDMEVLAMACTNLASKIEECPRRIRDVINVFHHVKQIRNKKTLHPMVLDQTYINSKNQVIKAERRILKELGFCVHVKHPHKMIVMYLEVLESVQNQKLVQCAWNYMNDSFRTDVFVKWHPETIACACIYMAARQLKVPLPNNPPWYELFGVFEDEVKDICLSILKLYARKKPNYEALEKKVNAARHIQLAKKKSRGLFSDTPNSNSGQNSPKNVSPNPTLLGSIKRIKKEEEDKNSSSSDKKKRKNGHAPSRSRSHSRSRSSRSSRSFSPMARKKKHHSPSPSHRSKKDRYSPDRRVKDKTRKRKRRSRSGSYSNSQSPDYRSTHKKRSKDKERDYKDRDSYYSSDKHSRKHRNGHHPSPPRDRLDKYDKYDKYRR